MTKIEMTGSKGQTYTINRIPALVAPHFVPYVNGGAVLVKGLASIAAHAERVVVVDNRDNFSPEMPPGRYAPYAVETWKPQTALSHSQLLTWLAFECRSQERPFFTWMHHDCLDEQGSLGALEALARERTANGEPWGALLTCDPTKPQDGPWNHVDVMAAINIEAAFAVGCWDWVRFPDYYSDYDFYGKLAKAEFPVVQTGLPILHQNGGSQTAALDRNRAEVKRETWEARGRLWAMRAAELGLEWPPR